MKPSHKKSNRMLVIGGILLVVYLLATIIFGSFMLERQIVESPRNRSITYTTFTLRHGGFPGTFFLE